jgi:hypothetical protein
MLGMTLPRERLTMPQLANALGKRLIVELFEK